MREIYMIVAQELPSWTARPLHSRNRDMINPRFKVPARQARVSRDSRSTTAFAYWSRIDHSCATPQRLAGKDGGLFRFAGIDWICLLKRVKHARSAH